MVHFWGLSVLLFQILIVMATEYENLLHRLYKKWILTTLCTYLNQLSAVTSSWNSNQFKSLSKNACSSRPEPTVPHISFPNFCSAFTDDHPGKTNTCLKQSHRELCFQLSHGGTAKTLLCHSAKSWHSSDYHEVSASHKWCWLIFFLWQALNKQSLHSPFWGRFTLFPV